MPLNVLLSLNRLGKTNTGYKVEIVGSKSALFFNKAGDPIGNY